MEAEAIAKTVKETSRLSKFGKLGSNMTEHISVGKLGSNMTEHISFGKLKTENSTKQLNFGSLANGEFKKKRELP